MSALHVGQNTKVAVVCFQILPEEQHEHRHPGAR